MRMRNFYASWQQSALAFILGAALLPTGCDRLSVLALRLTSLSRGSTPDHTVHRTPAHPGKLTFSAIPGGRARVGSVSSEPGRRPGTEQLREVSVAAFEISTTEVTKAQWFPIMQPSKTLNPSDANLPITGISHYEAEQFCELMTIKHRVVHRLPTEAEWELACRGRSDKMLGVWQGNCSLTDAISSFHRGDPGKLLRGIQASCNVNSGKLLPVGSFPANRFGLYDMQGNCWEWVSLDDTLTSPPSPLHAAIRGGSAFSTNPLECRAANRAWQRRSEGAEAIGFRVVRQVE